MSQDFQEIKCSNCSLPLYRVLAKPTEDKTYRINAKCPSCGDRAFEVKVTGKLIIASSDHCHAKPRPVYKERDSIDQPLEYTDQINIECEIYKPFKRK